MALPSLVEVLEALIVRRATQFVVELCLQHSVFEEDLEPVYKALLVGPSPHSIISHIVKDTLSIVSSLRTHSFFRSRRQDNIIAHALVRRAVFIL